MSSQHNPHDHTIGSVSYGVDGPTETQVGLLGEVRSKRVVELGCGDGRNLLALAQAGARAIGVDHNPAKLSIARARNEESEVKFETKESDIAELTFIGADTVDAALSIDAISNFADPGKLMRQAHRVLKNQGLLIVALAHPTADLLDENGLVTKSAFETSSITSTHGALSKTRFRHSIPSLVESLVKSGFRLEKLVEPRTTRSSRPGVRYLDRFPTRLIIKATKQA